MIAGVLVGALLAAAQGNGPPRTPARITFAP